MRPRARVPAYSKKVRGVLRKNAGFPNGKYIATVTKKLVSAQPFLLSAFPLCPISLYLRLANSVYNDGAF